MTGQCQPTVPSYQPPPSLAPPGRSKTFYKRDLPCPPAVAFSSPEGQAIFRSALNAGTMQGFFRLIEQFRTQDEPAYCGLASVAMVLNTLAIDPRRPWKGSWRFFHEQMLDCCYPLDKVREEGITLEQAACLARCNGASVQIYPHGTVSVETFRDLVKEAASSEKGDHHLVVSYSRKAFKQTGDGHFSPVGGYSPEHDKILLLDTARFKYPPHWVNLEELYHAMEHTDPTTGNSRGFMRVGMMPLLESVLFTIDVRDTEGFELGFRYLTGKISNDGDVFISAKDVVESTMMSQEKALSAESIITAVASAAPREAVTTFLATRTASGCSNSAQSVCTQEAAITTFLHELRSMPVYKMLEQHVAKQQEQSDTLVTERLTMLLLLLPASTWENLPEEVASSVGMLLDSSGTYKVVNYEALYLKEQMKQLPVVREGLGKQCAMCGKVSIEEDEEAAACEH